jgi:dephospho-CoA kinase
MKIKFTVSVETDEKTFTLGPFSASAETVKEAALRIGAQMPIGEKVRLSDRVVWNDGSLEALRREADDLVRDLSESGA